MDPNQIAADFHHDREAERMYQRQLRRETMMYDGLLIALVSIFVTSIAIIGHMGMLSLVKLFLIHPQIDDLPNALPRPHEWPWAICTGVISALGYFILQRPSFSNIKYRNWGQLRGAARAISIAFFIFFVTLASYFALKADGFWPDS
jgi:membrane-anchored glycerophosphoryl diester phosphodiesterase (GDPDase)